MDFGDNDRAQVHAEVDEILRAARERRPMTRYRLGGLAAYYRELDERAGKRAGAGE